MEEEEFGNQEARKGEGMNQGNRKAGKGSGQTFSLSSPFPIFLLS
jgi:hypothetical protein